MKTTERITGCIQMTECHNKLCKNVLPSNREKHKCNNLSRWWFCVPCLKSNIPIYYKCGYKDCSNDVILDMRHFSRFCSTTCRRRNRDGVKLEKKHICIICKGGFKSIRSNCKVCSNKRCRSIQSKNRGLKSYHKSVLDKKIMKAKQLLMGLGYTIHESKNS